MKTHDYRKTGRQGIPSGVHDNTLGHASKQTVNSGTETTRKGKNNISAPPVECHGIKPKKGGGY